MRIEVQNQLNIFVTLGPPGAAETQGGDVCWKAKGQLELDSNEETKKKLHEFNEFNQEILKQKTIYESREDIKKKKSKVDVSSL